MQNTGGGGGGVKKNVEKREKKLHKYGLKGLKIASFWVINLKKIGSTATIYDGGMVEVDNLYPCRRIYRIFSFFADYRINRRQNF